jgi:hypothetical protein
VAQSPERHLTGSDALILLWSAESELSDFVELEWNIAVAVKKPVMPWLMDATSLPTSLKPSHRISDKQTPKAVDQIVTALQAQPPSMVTVSKLNNS